MKMRQMDSIRQQLRSKLFTPRKSQYLHAEELKNQSPPTQQMKQQQKFRHFEDVYEFRKNKILGEGGHAVVKTCYKQSDSQIYAVKIFRTGDPEIINTIRQTFKINRSLNDLPCVIKAYDLFINAQREEVHLVMEYCNYPSLEKLMMQGLSEKEIIFILQQLSSAIEAIHSKGVCHRDIKPDNILVRCGLDLKLIDFGVSKKFFVKQKQQTYVQYEMWTRTGTILYQAPEVFKMGRYSEKIDIWAAGIITYQLLCGEFPFQCETKMDTIELICDPEFNVKNTPKFETLNQLQQDLLKRLLKKDPEKRLSAADFITHPYLQSSFQRKQNTKSFDDSDIQQSKYIDNLDLTQSQFEIKVTNHQKIFQQEVIQEVDELQSPDISRRQSWKYGNHVHYVPNQNKTFSLNIQRSIPKELQGSFEQQEEQQLEKLERLGSVQYE